jgi:hypothetical protein
MTLCWGAGVRAIGEIVRVTKPGGTISTCMARRCGTALARFREDPEHALALLSSRIDSSHDQDGEYPVFDDRETRAFLAESGVDVLAVYAYGLWNALSIPESVLDSRDWDERAFAQTAEALLRLAGEASVSGASGHATVYGRKRL